jgi:hypothetical protein
LDDEALVGPVFEADVDEEALIARLGLELLPFLVALDAAVVLSE